MMGSVCDTVRSFSEYSFINCGIVTLQEKILYVFEAYKSNIVATDDPVHNSNYAPNHTKVDIVDES